MRREQVGESKISTRNDDPAPSVKPLLDLALAG